MDNELSQYKRNKGKTVTDLSPVIGMTIKGIEKCMGRPAVYPDNTKGFDDFVQGTIDYWKWIEVVNSDPDRTNNTLPDIERWASFLGISRQTIFHYAKRGGIWRETIDYHKSAMMGIRKAAAEHYEIPPMTFVFDAVNNFGYANTNEFKLIQNAEQEEQKRISIDEKAKCQGLVWDESIQEYVIDA